MINLRFILIFQVKHNLGTIELYGSQDDAIQEILSNQPVRYKVRFPLQNPLPKLVQISLNGQVLCAGPLGMF